MPLLEKIKSHLTPAWGFLQHVASDVSSSAASFLHSQNIRTNIQDTVREMWHGFSQKFRIFSVYDTLKKSEKARTVMAQSLVANVVCYAGPVVVFEGVIKPALRYIPNVEDSYLESTLDLFSRVIFMRMAVRMFIDNTVYNACVANTITPVMPACRHVSGCDCESIKKVKANLASPFYFSGNVLSAYFVGLVPIVGEYPGYLIKTLAYGRCLVEYKYSALGMCTDHRTEILNKNNAYSFGLGASFLMMVGMCNALLRRATGAESAFIYDALFSFFYQCYIMLALLQDKPLPGTRGTDLFHYPRMLVHSGLKDSVNWLVPKLIDREIRANIQEQVKSALNFSFVQIGIFTLIEKEFHSLNTLVKRPAISLFIDYNQEDINKKLNAIIQARGYPLWLAEYAPDFIASESIKIILKILNEQVWDETIAIIKTLIPIAIRSREKTEMLRASLEGGVTLVENHIPEQKHVPEQKHIPVEQGEVVLRGGAGTNLTQFIENGYYPAASQPRVVAVPDEEDDWVNLAAPSVRPKTEIKRRHSKHGNSLSQKGLFSSAKTKRNGVVMPSIAASSGQFLSPTL